MDGRDTPNVDGGRQNRQVKRQSDEHVAYLLMGYLVRRKESHQAGCTAFHLTTRVPGLQTQRQPRVQELLNLLVERGYVLRAEYDKATYYEVTEAGSTWYKESMKKVFEVFERLYPMRAP